MALTNLRQKIGQSLFERVAGPDGDASRSKVHDTPGERWFGPDRPIRQVHGDAAMYIGGIRALLLQSLHPLAMAGVAGHSGYKGDPWGRLARTSYFLAITTFGQSDDAWETVNKVKSVHARVRGVAVDGRPYSASDPELLRWVHVAEIDSFLRAHQIYGAVPLDQAGRDGYVLDTSKVATALGIISPPTTEAELDDQIAGFRPQLAGTDAAREAARFMLLHPPLPLFAKGPYFSLALAALNLMPTWSRGPLHLPPHVPLIETAMGRTGGHVMTGVIRWALPGAPEDEAIGHDAASPEEGTRD